MDSAIPAPMAVPMQIPLWVARTGGIPSFTHIDHPLLQQTMPNTPEVVSMCMSPRVVPTRLSERLLLLQEKMNIALEQLIINGATGDLCH